jgi:Leucine-rich repeat (LRR) protein
MLISAACGDPPTPEPPVVKVDNISLDITDIALSVGENHPLTARIIPAEATDRRLDWSSSNVAVATVSDEGRVSAVGNGRAVITVKSSDGTRSARCEVTVEADLLEAGFIPDRVFLAYCQRQMETWDTDGDGHLTPGEAAAVTTMNVANINGNTIHSLKGIEYFTGLKTLQCYANNLTELDVSSCRDLEVLDCVGCALTTLDISGCSGLRELRCSNNRLSSLDVGKCNLLETLDVDGNRLPALDVSNCTRLRTLNCNRNGLSSLNLAGCQALEALNVKDNKLTLLDMSKNTALRDLSCSGNRLGALYVTKCAALEYLDCFSNQLSVLDVSNCEALVWLDCYDNAISELDLSRNRALSYLGCDANYLSELDLSANTSLQRLVCNNNAILTLDTSRCESLVELYCAHNSLSTLDIAQNVLLEKLVCNGNRLSGIGIGPGNLRLRSLYCENNDLEADDLNAIFEALPLAGPEAWGTITVKDNPGDALCETGTALAKNWFVTTD